MGSFCLSHWDGSSGVQCDLFWVIKWQWHSQILTCQQGCQSNNKQPNNGTITHYTFSFFVSSNVVYEIAFVQPGHLIFFLWTRGAFTVHLRSILTTPVMPHANSWTSKLAVGRGERGTFVQKSDKSKFPLRSLSEWKIIEGSMEMSYWAMFFIKSFFG